MMRINRVVTRTGDGGQTALIGGERVLKSALRVHSYGEVDELNSCLGLAVSWLDDTALASLLEDIQHRLFTVGADLAAPMGVAVPRVQAEQIDELEKTMEGLMDELPPLEEFILPGGGPAGAALHLARTVARRAERATVALSEHQEVNPQVIIYLNRLSDFLFVLARVVNRRQQRPETLAVFSQRKRRDPAS
jgi:cob(I)alamin adenosyltransferase